MSERGAVRPLWLAVGVLTCVLAGSMVNRCLTCAAPPPERASMVVRGELISPPRAPAPVVQEQPETDPPTAPDPVPAPEPQPEPAAEKKEEPEDEPLFKELTFDKLASWVYKFPDPNQKPMRPDPIPESIKKMTGEKFAIRGFMIPFKVEGEDVIEFLLVRNQFACCFGVIPKMNEWLHVKMAQGKKAPYAVDIPITVFGTLEAKELIEKSVVMSLYRMEATEVEEPPIFR